MEDWTGSFLDWLKLVKPALQHGLNDLRFHRQHGERRQRLVWTLRNAKQLAINAGLVKLLPCSDADHAGSIIVLRSIVNRNLIPIAYAIFENQETDGSKGSRSPHRACRVTVADLPAEGEGGRAEAWVLPVECVATGIGGWGIEAAEGGEMKLFVWEDVLSDYSSGMMFAIAPSVEEARKQLLSICHYIPEDDLNKQPMELEVSQPSQFIIWGGG